MKKLISIPNLLALCLFVCHPLLAQFNPGPNPISGLVTTPETISSGTGTIASDGNLQVSGSSIAISVNGSCTIVNNGTVNQTGTGRGIRNNTNNIALTITNNAGALIQTADNDAFQMNTANSSVMFDNYGSVISLNASGGGAQAIDWNAITTASNVLHNHSTGLLKATEADAVRPGVNGVVINEGTILSVTTTGSSSDGIDAQTNSGINITNSGSGLIEGGRHGITGGNTSGNGAYAMSITNEAGATIQGDNGAGVNIDGINGNELVTVTNHGMITGNGVTGDGDGVDVDGLVNLTNTGTIKSINAFTSTGTETSEGVTVGGGTIMNSGTIEGDVAAGNNSAVGRGITLGGIDTGGTPAPIYGNSTITNSGLIKGQSDSGIAVVGGASGFTVTINNLAGGVIEGGGATAAAIQTGADNDTVNNSGRIIADASGKAIDLGAGNDTLNISGGAASVVGGISGGSGTNSISFDPGSGHSFSYGGSISNFSSAEVRSGVVTLSGASTYSGDTTISAGTLLAHNTSGSATGTGSVFVQNTGTLGGDGQVGGNVFVASGGTISPGMSPGQLNILGNLTLTANSHLLFDLGPTSDLLTIAQSLVFQGSGHTIFDIINDGITPGSDFTLLTFASSSGFTLGNLAFGDVPPGFVGTFDLTSTSLILHVDAVDTVPELPSTGSLFAIALGGIVALSAKYKSGPGLK